jgi:uncharacterized membrane protein YjjP (DUF1212 family)
MAIIADEKDIKQIGAVLLEIGALLLTSGANTERVRTTLQRIADAFSLHCDVSIAYRALTLTINNETRDFTFSSVKRTPVHGVNFKIVAGISRMSWRVEEENWSVAQIKTEIDRLKSLPHYPQLLTLIMVSLSGAAFCRLAGGLYTELPFVFAATFVGLFVRVQAARLNFNPFVVIYFASLAASIVAAASVKFHLVAHHEYALVTAVLFLIPGVPLINSFSDVIDGNIQNAVIRGLNGLFISFTIALGLLSSIFIFQV